MKPLKDPLGNQVLLSASFKGALPSPEQLRAVITEPAFIIKVKAETLYFVRLVGHNLNLLIEAIAEEQRYVVINSIENPTADYISKLLEKGSLLSFWG